MFEGPDDGVQHQLELGRWDGEECGEAVRVYSLEKVEEVGPVLRVLFKVLLTKTHVSDLFCLIQQFILLQAKQAPALLLVLCRL